MEKRKIGRKKKNSKIAAKNSNLSFLQKKTVIPEKIWNKKGKNFD